MTYSYDRTADSREQKKRFAWAKKMRAKIEQAAKKVQGTEPGDWQHGYKGEAIWPPGKSQWDYPAPAAIGWSFNMELEGYVSAEVFITVMFEDNGAMLTKVETTVQGKKLPVVSKTARRIRTTDFFKPLAAYLRANQAELITPATVVWHSEDPAGNRHFGLTKDMVAWTSEWLDQLNIEGRDYELYDELEGFPARYRAIEDEREAEENAAWDRDEEPDDEALRKKYQLKFKALEDEFDKAKVKWVNDQYRDEGRAPLSELIRTDSEMSYVISDLKAKGSAGL